MEWLRALPEKCKCKVKSLGSSIKNMVKDDPRRVTHSLKVGIALTLVSLLYYWRPLYDGFGVAGMWAILTVVVVFEFTVGIYIYMIFIWILFIHHTNIKFSLTLTLNCVD